MNAFFNKNNLYNTIINVVLLAIIGMTCSCADEQLYNPNSYTDDGTLHMSVAFEPLYGVETTTRTSGEAIGKLKSLAILFYDLDGNLVNSLTQWGTDKGQGDTDILDWNLDPDGNNERPAKQPEDTPDDATQDEETTALATFRLQNIPYGRYKIYAVANMGDLSTDEKEFIDGKGDNIKIKDAILTENGLRNISLEWNKYDIGANNQMFGYFSPQLNNESAYSKPGDFDAPEITVSKETPKLYAWVRRAASKVTIAYDGSDLKDNVWIYIHKVTIRDIPSTCLLGEINTPDKPFQLIEGGTLFYNNDGVTSEDPSETDHKKWLTITNDDKEPVGSDHSKAAQALFFYENMQGDYEGQEKFDKRQKKDYLGVLVYPGDKDYKDEVPYGTYIEVEAFYDSRNPENITSGKIIYRFMLGKNVTYNYNAERNHHFKLTLKFNGWANQADWHIEYTEEEPSIQTPPIFYMPYLYNQQAMFPMTLNGNVQSLEVEIIENGWAPVSLADHEVPKQTVGDFTWNLPAYNRFPPWQGTKEVDGVEKEGFPQLGFLALAVPGDKAPQKNILDEYNYDAKGAYEALYEDYTKEYTSEDNYKYSQQKRTYNVQEGTHQSGYNEYTVKKAAQGESYSVQIPLWTRNKTMIQNSGYTGNNPYEAFERKAIIKITATFLVNGVIESKTKDVNVYQVRRIVNPKGVWRSRNNKDEDFFVHLMTLNNPNDPEYTYLTSNGSWDASIESGDKSFCFITTNPNATTGTDLIKGNTGSEIMFYVKFKDKLASGVSKGCVININYDGGTCTHKILVRQGYDEAVPVIGDSPLWSSFNLFRVNCDDGYNDTSNYTLDAELTCNPLAVGSLFRRRNYNKGILVLNNDTYGPLVSLGPDGDSKLKVAQKNNDGEWVEKKWSEIKAYRTENANTIYKWATFSAIPSGYTEAKTYRVPTYKEFKALDDADYAIGVVYADGATKTQKKFEDAYGYEDGENTLNRSDKGVRGFIVYNPETGHQILFPIGKYGMARRTVFNLGDGNEKNAGYLRYGDVYDTLNGETNELRPIPYDLAHCPGAIYWINLPEPGGHAGGGYCGGWDMNYFSLDFSSYTYNNRNDACPIKLVTDSN